MAIGKQAKELLKQKADLEMVNLTDANATLPVEQSLRFVRNILDTPTMLGDIRVIGMKSHTKRVNNIGFDSRIMHEGPASMTALAASKRSKPDLGYFDLTTVPVRAEVNLPYEVVEDIIEQVNIGSTSGAELGGSQMTGQFKNTIMDMIAERAALDIEELILLGDTAVVGSDPYLGQFDGFLKIAENSADANEVDVSALSSSMISREMFKKALQTMPQKYLRNRGQMKHYISHSNDAEYRDIIAARQTAAGDSAATGMAPIYAFGVPTKIASLMPDTAGLFTHPKNLCMGIWRDIMIETDKDIRAQAYIIVLSMRLGIVVEREEALLHYSNITAP